MADVVEAYSNKGFGVRSWSWNWNEMVWMMEEVGIKEGIRGSRREALSIHTFSLSMQIQPAVPTYLPIPP